MHAASRRRGSAPLPRVCGCLTPQTLGRGGAPLPLLIPLRPYSGARARRTDHHVERWKRFVVGSPVDSRRLGLRVVRGGSGAPSRPSVSGASSNEGGVEGQSPSAAQRRAKESTSFSCPRG